MPIIVASILGGLIQIAATLAGRVVLALGFSVVVFTGLSTTLDFIKAQTISALSSMGDAVVILSQLKIDVAVSILTSAVAGRLLLNGLTNGSVARWITKP